MSEEKSSKIINNSAFNILDGYGHDGGIIFTAGTTCYKSEDKTKKTPEDFIKMFKKLKHMSMTEFMWVSIVIKDQNHLIADAVFSWEKFLTCSRLTDQNTVISGNARAWLEFMVRFKTHFKKMDEKKKKKNLYWIAYNTIGELLNAANPVMFDLEYERLEKPLESSIVQSIEEEDVALYNKHHWVAVKFKDVSRGLIDELRTHRLMSYAVSSTRYIDNSNFNLILPKLNAEDHAIFVETVQVIQESYKKLLDNCIKKDVVRQLLPLGLSQEVVVAGTVENWKYIFDVRSKPNVHWEIRNVLKKLMDVGAFNSRGFDEEKV